MYIFFTRRPKQMRIIYSLHSLPYTASNLWPHHCLLLFYLGVSLWVITMHLSVFSFEWCRRGLFSISKRREFFYYFLNFFCRSFFSAIVWFFKSNDIIIKNFFFFFIISLCLSTAGQLFCAS